MLDETRGGPPVLPDKQIESRRRSLYFFHSNNDRNLFLTTFDEAAVKECYRREASIVPQQALALSNSRLALDTADAIAEIISNNAADDVEFIRTAFALLVGIDPTPEEIAASQEALVSWRSLEDTKPQQERARLIWVLINHNDFVTLR